MTGRVTLWGRAPRPEGRMFSRHRRCTPRRLAALAGGALLVAMAGGCGNTDDWVDAVPAAGWSSQYADAANSSYTPTAGAEALKLQWSRSAKGSLFGSGGRGGRQSRAV